MSNFLVNAKTKILEFKRKHNLLVKSGVKEIVNKEIEQGNIAVGTKLYRHRIVFTNTDSNEEVGIVLTSTLGTLVNDFGTLTDVLDKAVHVNYLTRMSIDSPPPESYTCIGYDDQYYPIIKYLIGNSVSTYYLDTNYIEDYSDRVTPL